MGLVDFLLFWGKLNVVDMLRKKNRMARFLFIKELMLKLPIMVAIFF